MNKMCSISLIVSFYNKIDLLRLILKALEKQQYKDFEVIIADDGSKPEVVDEISRIRFDYPFFIKHVWHEDIGWRKNAALNKAVAVAEGVYLVFIDGDCIPHPDFLLEHVENRAKRQIVSGRRVMLTQKVSDKITLEIIEKNKLTQTVFLPLLVENLFYGARSHIENMLRIRNKFLRRLFVKDKRKGFWGCNFSLWKADLLQVNGFDERFVHPGIGEDGDLENRLARIGVFAVSKKHLVTQYHYFHEHFDTKIEENFMLLEENNRNGVTYTPYGIHKKNIQSFVRSSVGANEETGNV